MKVIPIFVATLFAASTVQAADFSTLGTSPRSGASIQCSIRTSLMSKVLFNNTGTYASAAPAIIILPECSDSASGWYGNLFLDGSAENWNNGKAIPEVDVRVGRRWSVGGIDFDASMANYTFYIGGVGTFDTLNGRVRVSHTFDLGRGLTVQPYGIIDAQRNLTPLNADALAIALGTNWGLQLTTRLSANVDLAVWSYVAAWTVGKGPIYSVQPSFSYLWSDSITMGPQATFTWGDITDMTNNHKLKAAYGAFVNVKF